MSMLLQDPSLKIAINYYNHLCEDDQLRELEWVQEKTERDRISEIAYMLQEARQQAREERRQEIWEEERQKGLQEGREEGVGIGIKKTILRNFSRWYPQADSSEIQQILQSVDKEDDLNYLQDLFFDCPTASDFLLKAREIK